jgi:hypothetical protein
MTGLKLEGRHNPHNKVKTCLFEPPVPMIVRLPCHSSSPNGSEGQHRAFPGKKWLFPANNRRINAVATQSQLQ